MKAQIQPTSHPDTKPRILVIEDHSEMRTLLVLLLTRNGFEVEATKTGQEGLRVAQTQDFDLILSDIGLSGINGFETCRQLKQHPKLRDIPIIIMSGRLAEENCVQAFKIGAAEYISKPFAAPDLLQKISTHIRKTKASSGYEG